jgi:hypothetical protein
MCQLYLDLSNCFRIAFFLSSSIPNPFPTTPRQPPSLQGHHHHHAVDSSVPFQGSKGGVSFCCINGHVTTRRRRRRRSSSTQIYFLRIRHHPLFHSLYVAWHSRRTHHAPAIEPSQFPTHTPLPPASLRVLGSWIFSSFQFLGGNGGVLKLLSRPLQNNVSSIPFTTMSHRFALPVPRSPPAAPRQFTNGGGYHIILQINFSPLIPLPSSSSSPAVNLPSVPSRWHRFLFSLLCVCITNKRIVQKVR